MNSTSRASAVSEPKADCGSVETFDSLAASLATEDYWEQKATRSRGDVGKAVGHDDPWQDRCIERAQRPVITRAIRSSARSLGENGNSVLDFGCGVGRWIAELRSHFPNYHGVDISTSMLKIASDRHPDCEFSKLNNLKLDSEDESVDFAMSIAVLHHNSYENQDVLLTELSRVLRPDGELLLFESNGPRSTRNVEIHYSRPPEDWVAGAEKHGFRLVEKSGTAYYLISRIVSRIVGSDKWLLNPLGRASLWLDSIITPIISPYLPHRFHARILMRFRKDSIAQSA